MRLCLLNAKESKGDIFVPLCYSWLVLHHIILFSVYLETPQTTMGSQRVWLDRQTEGDIQMDWEDRQRVGDRQGDRKDKQREEKMDRPERQTD